MRSGSSGQTSAKRAIAASAAAVGVGVRREALAEHRQDVAPGGRERRIGRRLAGGLDPGPRGGPARPRVGGGRREVLKREADVDRARPRLGPRPGGKVGQAVEEQHDLDHRSFLAPARRAPAAPRASPFAAGRRSIGPPRPRTSRPPSSTTPRALLLVDDHPLHRCLDMHSGTGRLGRRAQRRRHGAHAAAREAPCPRRAGRLAEVVVEGDEGGPRIVRAGERPDQALDRERHAHRLRRHPGELVGDRARRATPARSPRATARGRAARASAGGLARRLAPSARSSPRSRRRPRATSRARAERGSAPARTR